MAVYDFESILKPIMRDDCPEGNKCTKDVCNLEHPGSTIQVAEHKPCGYSLIILNSKGTLVEKDVYRGEDADTMFLKRAIQLTNPLFEIISEHAKKYKNPPKLSAAEEELRDNATECYLCKKPFKVSDQRICHHNHLVDSEKYLGFVHASCNFRAKLKIFIPFYAMNASSYDNHFVLKSAAEIPEVSSVSAIAQTREKFMSMTLQTKDDNKL